jgi:hypothetical protein
MIEPGTRASDVIRSNVFHEIDCTIVSIRLAEIHRFAKTESSRSRLLTLMARIVFVMEIVDRQRSVSAHLCNVFARSCPMEMMRAARQYDDTAWRIGLQCFCIKHGASSYIEDTRYHGVDSVLPMHVRHHSGSTWQLDADYVRSRRRQIPDQNCKSCLRWEGWKGQPADILVEDRSKYFELQGSELLRRRL